jgi:hypothetical protein
MRGELGVHPFPSKAWARGNPLPTTPSHNGWALSSSRVPLRNPFDLRLQPLGPNPLDKLGSWTPTRQLGTFPHHHGAPPWVIPMWGHASVSCLARKGMSLTFVLKRLTSSLTLLNQCPPRTTQIMYQQVFARLTIPLTFGLGFTLIHLNFSVEKVLDIIHVHLHHHLWQLSHTQCYFLLDNLNIWY